MDLRYPETLKEYGKPGAKKDGDGGAEDGEEKEHPAIARVRCMMGREIRVKVVDGRVFEERTPIGARTDRYSCSHTRCIARRW